MDVSVELSPGVRGEKEQTREEKSKTDAIKEGSGEKEVVEKHSEKVHLWLRAEVKRNEHRAALTPAVCKQLIHEGFQITVERSQCQLTRRCYPDHDYERIGCTLASEGSWPQAPRDAFIVGLKELPDDGSALVHRHIYFGHCYKNQSGWRELLSRFDRGGGLLLDMEFLLNANGGRVAAFGFMAGFVGAFLGLDMWCQQQLAPEVELGAVEPFSDEVALFSYVKQRMSAVKAQAQSLPRVLIMGALGRCGSGATDFLCLAGIPRENVLLWDMAETHGGGPFPAILDVDIFINAIYLIGPIPPFLTAEMLEEDNNRKLAVIVDVSADTTNPLNPLPFANKATSFEKPSFRLSPSNGTPIDICTIDHMPTLLPKESSDTFATDLLASIRDLAQFDKAIVWQRSLQLFREKLAQSKMTDQ